MKRRRNSKVKFVANQEFEKISTEIISISIPDLRTLLRSIITFIFLLPWAYLILYKMNIKDRLIDILIWMFNDTIRTDECNGSKNNAFS